MDKVGNEAEMSKISNSLAEVAMKLQQFKLLTVAAAGILASTVAMAQEETLGTSSFADFNANLTVTDQVLIQGVSDLSVDGTTQDVSNNYIAEDTTVCFFTNSGAGLTATVTSTPSYAFDNTSSTPFSIELNSGAGSDATFTSAAPGPTTIATGAVNSVTAGNCDETNDGFGFVRVVVAEDDYINAVGDGDSTVTITLNPL